MSETAQTLIESAFRTVGVLAVGETLPANDAAIGLQNMKFMFRHWSAKNIRLYCTTQDTLTLTSSASYTWGTGGNITTARPSSIRGAYVKDSNGFDNILKIVEEKFYREIAIKTLTGTALYLWYSPEYPLAKIYLYPLSSGTLYIDSLKALSDPSALSSSVSFPPEYDEAIKYGLAIRLGAEYGRPIAPEVVALAKASMEDLEIKNFAEQINAVRPEIISIANRYNINEG